MNNKEIAGAINLMAKLMELHEMNKFKIRSYSNAYASLRKVETPLEDISMDDLSSMPGIGKSVVEKINEYLESGAIADLEKLKEMTPSGVIEILGIKGIGPKKVHTIWKDLNVTSPGELLYACHENRLVEQKGFGAKTQNKLIEQLNYYLDSKGKFLYSKVFEICTILMDSIEREFPDSLFSFVGDIRMKNPIVESIEILSTVPIDQLAGVLGLENDGQFVFYENLEVEIIEVDEEYFYDELFAQSGEEEFLETFEIEEGANSEEEIFESLGLNYIPPERRINAKIIDEYREQSPDLIRTEDIKGVVHSHTTYSDGLYSIRDMVLESKKLGYDYIVITDHSKSAFYANGLSIERVQQQWNEIDALNNEDLGIKIFKSVESDILNDGSLDYPDDILKGFDMIIASVHSNLNMTEEKATSRLIKAIENEHTHMLGHPTGRLLLSRKGYPINHKKIIDACSSNNVSIEINANPLRLDIDYRWLDSCREKNIQISINPDAHSLDQIQYIKWGVEVARKGGLRKKDVLNSRSLKDFEAWINKLY